MSYFPSTNVNQEQLIKDVEIRLSEIENHHFDFEVYLDSPDILEKERFNRVVVKFVYRETGDFREVTLHPIFAHFMPAQDMIERVMDNKYRIYRDITKKLKLKKIKLKKAMVNVKTFTSK